ncbi:Mitochondrial ATP synthase subunit G protein [Raphanus sativus]|nr:Mitochondrial ATP synthase subunit G protein [Raphanus sativus]
MAEPDLARNVLKPSSFHVTEKNDVGWHESPIKNTHLPHRCRISLSQRIWFLKMASKLVQVQSKACEASKFVAKHGTSYYRQLLEKNKHYIQEPATVEKCQELSKQLLYTRLASIPKRYETFWKEVDYAKNLWKNRTDLKVEDAGIAALFGLECFAWYCAGEIAGRGFTFTGYYP